MTRNESTKQGALMVALFRSQLRYAACILRVTAYVVQSGDVAVIGACAALLGE